MKYCKTVTLKNGEPCILRNGTEKDAQEVIDIFILTHGQTDFLASYPDEFRFTLEQEEAFLRGRAESERDVYITAVVGGRIVGTAGVQAVSSTGKFRHRASFGISVDEAFWGLGIGRALTEACIECAKTAGYTQLELEVVADNFKAMNLYKSFGFVECGRNPKGSRSRYSGWQELVMMRLELD